VKRAWWTGILVAVVATAAAQAGPAGFSAKPTVKPAAGGAAGAEISFAASAATDVEVAIVDAKENVVRHLAAGVLGGKLAPPPPLKEGLAQTIAWDGKDDFAKPAPADGGPFKVRVRLGMGAKFARCIGEDPYQTGAINSITVDETGQLYVMTHGGDTNMNYDTLRVFAADGSYVRTLLPLAADTPPEAAKGFANWDEQAKTLRPINRSNTNPSFAPWTVGAHIVSASSKAGIVLTHETSVYRIDVKGGNLQGPMPMWSPKAGLKNPAWNIPQLAVSPDGRYIYYANVAGTVYQPKSINDIDPKWPQGESTARTRANKAKTRSRSST